MGRITTSPRIGLVLALGMLLRLTASGLEAQCLHPIPLLGGRTAIYRGKVLDTPEALKAALKRPKVREAFLETLERAGLSGHFLEVMSVLDGMTTDRRQSYPRGTRFDWMAIRLRATKRVALLRDSCWEGSGSLAAWTFELKVEGQRRTFVVPTICLNLAELRTPPRQPPTCALTTSLDCSSPSPQITLKATAESDNPITEMALEETRPDGTTLHPVPTRTPTGWELTGDVSLPGNYVFTASVTDSRGLKSPPCQSQVALCSPPPALLCQHAPTCRLHAAGSWQNGAAEGEIQISTAGSTQTVSLEIHGPDGRVIPSSSIEKVNVSMPGDYEVTLTATGDTAACKPAVCSSTVRMEPIHHCCDSPWELRALALGAEAEGHRQEGRLPRVSGGTAGFEFGFGDGLGAGFELERRLGGAASNWGWTLGLLRTDLSTRWQLDLPTRFLLDHPRVPVTLLTTGANYHLRVGRASLFAGPLIGYARFNSGTYPDDSARAGTFRANFQDEFTYGVNVGFDDFFRECWGITGGVEYWKLTAKAGALDANVDPLLVRLGVVYRF